MKKLMVCASAITIALTSSFMFSGCNKKTSQKNSTTDAKYSDIQLGTSYKDLTASIKVINHRTDMMQSDYPGKSWPQYLKEFNKMYPNITVTVDTITTYADSALLRLQGQDWGDIMMIPAVDKKDLSTYFLPYGTLDEMKKQIRFADTWEYNGQVYGVPSTGNAQGIVYNKKVFKEAGITKLPKTPEEFIADLQKIKDQTDAIPLYTNYAAGWTMSAWDAYLGGSATGDPNYMNQELLHEKNPFANKGDDTHPYAVYKILYDAAAKGLIENDYSTTDWEGSKGMINNGKIGCMVLGSWAYPQMQAGGPNPQDIGYMSFPISINGKQYATSGADYSFGINIKSSADNQIASLIFVKWMTEKSGFAYNEGGIPVAVDDNKYPEVYSSFSDNNVKFIVDAQALPGESDLLNSLNSDSELNVNAGGNLKVQRIIEHASNGDESFDDIMKEWNEAWSRAQESENVTVK